MARVWSDVLNFKSLVAVVILPLVLFYPTRTQRQTPQPAAQPGELLHHVSRVVTTARAGRSVVWKVARPTEVMSWIRPAAVKHRLFKFLPHCFSAFYRAITKLSLPFTVITPLRYTAYLKQPPVRFNCFADSCIFWLINGTICDTDCRGIETVRGSYMEISSTIQNNNTF